MERNRNQFKVFKGKDKEKFITVTTSNDKPTIKEISVKKNFNREFDISIAPKIFIPITGESLFHFKILLKDPNGFTSYYCKDQKAFTECVDHIDNVLTRYHRNRESLDSVTSTTGSSRSSESESARSSKTKDQEDDDKTTAANSSSENTITKDAGSDDYMTMQNIRRSEETESSYQTRISDAMNWIYEVPQFDLTKTPIKASAIIGLPNDYCDYISNILELRKEMFLPGGIEIEISKVEISDIEVLQYQDSIWISAIEKCSNLNKCLHVGDKIWMINNQIVSKKVEFVQFSRLENIVMRIQRMPLAKVFAITNLSLKTSCNNKELVFANSEFNKSLQTKESWIITEFNFTTHLDLDLIQEKARSNIPFHTIVLHPSSFLKQLRCSRKSSLSKL